jgi:hypothetical protein
MQYVIATDSRKRAEILFMVDRSKCTLSFWSRSTINALVYEDSRAAEEKAGSLKFNNPRIMTLSAAQKLSDAQNPKPNKRQTIEEFCKINMIPLPNRYADKMLCQSALGLALYAKNFQVSGQDLGQK